MGKSDEQIIRDVLAGDKEAFGELIDRYSGLVFSICLSHTRNGEDSKDLSQETFIKTFGILKDLKQPAAFRKWLSRIATSVSINWLRQQKHPVSISNFDLGTTVLTAVRGGPEAHPTTATEADMMAEVLDAALEALPEEFRLCIILKYVEGLSYSEIADFLDVGINTVKNRMHHGKIMLRNRLSRYEQISSIFDSADVEANGGKVRAG